MDNIYLLMLAALTVLAVVDLVVGVSNDAVNFLNSAIGSQALSLRKILIIASIGILIGAVFSSGMMEVARKGIFNPSEFYFNEIMFIFMAVMVGDILLLDFFNTIGMPTSTTVSIVFNLLGAAIIMSILKISADDAQTLSNISQYINTEKAIQIISGIVLSVFIAFTIGAFVQWLTRVVFTFNYEKNIKKFGHIFAGLCLTGVGFFILFKGLKGTPFYSDIKSLLDEYYALFILFNFLFWTLVSFVVDKVFKKNILVLVVAFGTFGLALAFAGNDLVNFIGVPMAAYHSYEAWDASGIAATDFSMEVLSNKVPAEPWLLVISGLIMVVTLWFSKKARTVTETEIGLANQNDGQDRFDSNMLSRSIVKGSTRLASLLGASMPQSVQNKINKSFERPQNEFSKDDRKNQPAFDLIRASVNLTVAGILISIATSMKLPLSTTYVTFMVAMGTSLADKAWGRDSAAYRVAGVVNVIGGWFFTAISALVISGVITFVIYKGGMIAVVFVLLVTALVLVRNFLKHKNISNAKLMNVGLKKSESKTVKGIINESSDNIADVMKRTSKIYNSTLEGLFHQDVSALKKIKKKIKQLDDEVEELRNHLFYFIKNLEEESIKGSHFYITVLAQLTDIVQSLEYCHKKSFKHIDNNHKPLRYNQIKDLKEITNSIVTLLDATYEVFSHKNFSDLNQILDKSDHYLNLISKKIDDQVSRTRNEEASPKNTTLYFNLLLETKDLLGSIFSLSSEYQKASKK